MSILPPDANRSQPSHLPLSANPSSDNGLIRPLQSLHSPHGSSCTGAAASGGVGSQHIQTPEPLSIGNSGSMATSSSDSRGSSKKGTDLRTTEANKGSHYHNLGSSSQKSSAGRGGLSSQFRSDQFRSTQRNGKLAAVVGSSHVDQLANCSVSPQSTVAHSMARKSQMMNGNHLLNFHYDPISRPRPRPQPRVPPSRKLRKAMPYNKDLFLQANFKFVVLDLGNYAAASMDPDKMLQWDDVICVRYSTPFPVQCPICLESPLCPQITSCGHVFCFPCILRYLLMGEEDHKGDCWKKCPLCFMMISSKDLYTVHVDYVKQYNVGDQVNFTLLTRQKDSLIPYQKDRQGTGFIHDGSDGLSDAFSKFHLTSDVELAVREAKMELNDWLAKAESGLVDDLEPLPYVCAALEQLEQRQKCWAEHQSVSGSPPSRNSTLNESLPSRNSTLNESLPSRNSTLNESLPSRNSTLNESLPSRNSTINGSPPLNNCSNPVLRCKYNPSKTKSHVNADEMYSKSCESAYNTSCTGCSYESDGTGPSLYKLGGDDSVSLSGDASEFTEGPEKLPSLYDEEKSLQRHLDGCKDAKERDFYSFYQACDGQHLILHPLNMKCLLQHYGSRDLLPSRIGGRILQLETVTQSEIMRRRYRFLSHFSLTTVFQLCEIDLSDILPPDALSPFMDDIKKREKQRKRVAKKENEEKAKAEAAALQERPIPSDFRCAAYNETTFSMDDFEALGASTVPPSTSPPVSGERKRFSEVTRLGFAAAHDSPSLKMDEPAGDTPSNREASGESSGLTGARPTAATTLSFADIISTAQSAGGPEAAKMSGLGKRGKKPSRVLLSTAGGRRY